LAQDLEAFCAAHYKAEKGEIIRKALRSFIDARLDEEPVMKARFLKERALLTKAPVVSLRAYDARKSDSLSRDEPNGAR